MGYFANGTEGLLFEEQYCERCVHYVADPESGTCPVWMAHLLYNYEQHSNEAVKVILGLLIPRIPTGNECAMFYERDEE